MEKWNIGMLDKWVSIIPVFQYSIHAVL